MNDEAVAVADAGEEMAAMASLMARKGNRREQRYALLHKAKREGLVHAVYTRQHKRKRGRK